MANASIKAAFERMWQHIVSAIEEHKVGWNDLQDKPFGEFETGGDTLIWDGNTDGLVSCGTIWRLWKVSDIVPTFEELQNGFVLKLANGYSLYSSNYTVSEDGVLISFDGAYGAIVLKDNVTFNGFGFAFPNKGVYMHEMSSLTINNFTGFPHSKDIDDKYIPDTIARVENIPMLANVEYQTTEQFLGEYVYTKVVDCGALVDNDVMEIPHGISNIGIITDMKVIITSEPYFSNYVGDELPTNVTDTYIFIDTITHDAMIGKTVAVVIKYTKK